jgi:hypothetical protein
MGLQKGSLQCMREYYFVRTLKAVLSLSLPAYFVFLFVNHELDFLKFVEVPLVFASILLLISMVECLERQAKDDSRVFVRLYETQGDFYRELRNKVDEASKRVFTTYLRRYKPGLLGEAADSYFAKCRAWADKSSDHVFRRVVIRSEHEGMAQWLENELAAAEAARAKGRHYSIRLLEWELHDADALSIAIIDSDYIFVAFSGEEDKLTGFSVRSPRLVSNYFLPYFEKMWAAAQVPAAGLSKGSEEHVLRYIG